MLTSIAIILLTGMLLGWISKKIKLPALLGMIFTGIIIGPSLLNMIDGSLIVISADLRKIALVIILTRAGLSLDIKELMKAGRAAMFMCFIPASFEIIGMVIFAPMIFGISYLEAALLGSVIAAVSPAVVVPRMIKILNEKYGADKQIPQIILAGASADDVYVIVLFTSFSAILSGGKTSVTDFIQIPTSIILGVFLGIIIGFLFSIFIRRVHIRDSVKVIILISVSFLILALEGVMENYIHMSGLIAIMVVGMTIFSRNSVVSKRLSEKYNKLWLCAEIILFVLVGVAVDLNSIGTYGISAVLVLLIAMVFRMAGVFVSLIKTKLSMKERLFCMLAYTPKATVQAAIGTIPLALGLKCGGLILSVAVLSILITAPFGAFMIDLTYKKLLNKDN